MWTSSILLFLSMFSAEAAEMEQSVRSQVALIRAAESQPAIATAAAPVAVAEVKAPARQVRKVVAPKAPATRAVAPVAEPVPVVEPALQIGATPAPLVFTQPMIKLAPPSKAQEIVGKVQGFYNETKSFTASFSQTVTNSTFSKLKPKASSGKVYILKPGKMRWDYRNESYRTSADPKVSKSFISDGKFLWAVMHKNKQFYKESLSGSALPVAVSFLMGTGNLLNDFNVTQETSGKFGSKTDILLLLTPKVPSARYKKLWLVVDPTNYSVKQSVVLNSKGDTNSIVFTKVELNSGKLKNGHFIFNEAANKDFSLIKPPEQ